MKSKNFFGIWASRYGQEDFFPNLKNQVMENEYENIHMWGIYVKT